MSRRSRSRARGRARADSARDRELAEELRTSAKDRAENVMIVDLLRNDLGKCCVPGSVRASKLFDIESFASVHQLVSTVEGRLAPGQARARSRRGVFPRRLDHGRAEGRRDEDHRGARAAAAQRLLRLDRLHRLRRQHGSQHRDSHARAARQVASTRGPAAASSPIRTSMPSIRKASTRRPRCCPSWMMRRVKSLLSQTKSKKRARPLARSLRL